MLSKNINNLNIQDAQLVYYLAGLLEGDGHISLLFMSKIMLNRILSPKIVFTWHIKDIALYAYIQHMLEGVGPFDKVDKNTIRYVIGDIKGIILFINTVHSKLRTPKNKSFNELIEFINKKYSLIIEKSIVDKSNLFSNSWLAGFTEADGHFGVKILESKPKSDTGKRSVSYNTSIVFRLNQRLPDRKTYLSL